MERPETIPFICQEVTKEWPAVAHLSPLRVATEAWSRESSDEAPPLWAYHLIGREADERTVEEEIRSLRLIMLQQAEEISRLSHAFKAHVATAIPTRDRTIEIALSDDVRRVFRGRRVAIHPRIGVVADGADALSVVARVRELGLLDDVVLHSIPES